VLDFTLGGIQYQQDRLPEGLVAIRRRSPSSRASSVRGGISA
jgi:hypothetical protein